MDVRRLVVLAVCGLPMASAAAQGFARGTRAGVPAEVIPRLMVANPFAAGAGDSAAAVQIGNAIRQSFQKQVGNDYALVTQQQMHEALAHYGFQPDATLSPALAVTLAKNIGSRVAVTGTLSRAADDGYLVAARLVGVSDEAGNVVEVSQQPGEPLTDFGARVAKALAPAVRSLGDAQRCMNELAKPDQAAKAADKALRSLPNHGLAQFCLYQLARQRGAPRQETVRYLEAAVKGDPLSASAWRSLLAAYEEAKDTAASLAAAQHLLQITPTDRELRQHLFRYLLDSGQSKAALTVADEGLEADPFNPELYDLKADACLFLRDFPCAVQSLERLYATDSTKADTLFFAKIAAAAVAGDVPDTTRLLTWARTGARTFPDNRTILGYLDQAYVWTGQVDSSLAVTRRIMARDTAVVVPALAVVQLLVKANRLADGTPYLDVVRRHGTRTQQDQLARMLVPVALTRLQGDSAANQAPDLTGAIDLARTVLGLVDSTSEVAQYADFALGAALFRQGTDLDHSAEQEKSCPLARQESQLMADAKTALANVHLTKYQAVTQQYLGYADQYGTRTAAMVKAYCR